MKKVAGKLKLELAAFRELETFAKFGSDLDKSTQIKLARGVRMVEMLKQKENNPISFHKQAILIYAGINGYLDTLSIKDVSAYEAMLYERLDTTHKELSKEILTHKKLTDEIEAEIKELVKDLAEEFGAKNQ
jgi:F-type H+-transporting ATPase subunit alpha